METKDLNIIVLLIVIAVLFVLYIIARRINSVYLLDPLKDCCNPEEPGFSFDRTKIGQIRGIIKAKKRLPFNHIYGYAIDFKHIEEMYKDICSYNDTCHQYGLKEIVGVRIYEGISERLIEKELKTKADLVMIPYLKGEAEKKCEDIYTVDEERFHSEQVYPKMYAHFRPCPKLCGDERLCIG